MSVSVSVCVCVCMYIDIQIYKDSIYYLYFIVIYSILFYFKQVAQLGSKNPEVDLHLLLLYSNYNQNFILFYDTSVIISVVSYQQNSLVGMLPRVCKQAQIFLSATCKVSI